MVRVDVMDNGKGLPRENRQRLLEPYMTTREKGTGLGLAIVKKIVEDHGGSLELHDAPEDFYEGRGAMISIFVPAAAATSTAADEGDLASNHAGIPGVFARLASGIAPQALERRNSKQDRS